MTHRGDPLLGRFVEGLELPGGRHQGPVHTTRRPEVRFLSVMARFKRSSLRGVTSAGVLAERV